MNNKAELEMRTIVVIIIAVFVLSLMLVYVFSTEGGPKSLIDNILDFMNSATDYVETTGKI